MSIDLTGLGQSWVDGTIPNNGVLLEQSAGNTSFKSSEVAPIGDRPRLDVCYVAP